MFDREAEGKAFAYIQSTPMREKLEKYKHECGFVVTEGFRVQEGGWCEVPNETHTGTCCSHFLVYLV